MNAQDQQPPEDPRNTPTLTGSGKFANRPYQVALMVAVLLFLVTLTISMMVLIISRDDQEDRQQAFDTTLTAVHAAMLQTQTALLDRVHTPEDVPPPVYREYPFVLASGAPRYTAADSCNQQVLAGTIRDLAGQPVDALNVSVWGDHIATQTVLTGELTGQDPGRWRVTLDNAASRRVFVQLNAAGRYVSAPVELIFDATDCAHNRASVDFEQVAPLQ